MSELQQKIEFVGADYIARLVGLAVSTVKVDATRRPESLPPRHIIPGRRKQMWLKTVADNWFLNAGKAPEPKPFTIKRGR